MPRKPRFINRKFWGKSGLYLFDRKSRKSAILRQTKAGKLWARIAGGEKSKVSIRRKK